MENVQPIILAAGKGTRMGNPGLPKVLAPLAGKPLVQYLLNTLAATRFPTPVLVIGYERDQVKQVLGSKYRYVIQEEQLGTGHAVASCRAELEGTAEHFLVINGDQPLTSARTLERLVEHHLSTGAVMSQVTIVSDHPTFQSYGRIIRDASGNVTGIREQKDCTEEEKKITEVNAGLYCFRDDWLWSHLEALRAENAQAEYYITDLLAMAINEGHAVSTVHFEHWWEGLGINTPEQLQQVLAHMPAIAKA